MKKNNIKKRKYEKKELSKKEEKAMKRGHLKAWLGLDYPDQTL